MLGLREVVADPGQALSLSFVFASTLSLFVRSTIPIQIWLMAVVVSALVVHFAIAGVAQPVARAKVSIFATHLRWLFGKVIATAAIGLAAYLGGAFSIGLELQMQGRAPSAHFAFGILSNFVVGGCALLILAFWGRLCWSLYWLGEDGRWKTLLQLAHRIIQSRPIGDRRGRHVLSMWARSFVSNLSLLVFTAGSLGVFVFAIVALTPYLTLD